MHNLPPPYTSYTLSSALVEERGNNTSRLKVARFKERAGLPWKQRFCARCGEIFVNWGAQLLATAQLPPAESDRQLQTVQHLLLGTAAGHASSSQEIRKKKKRSWSSGWYL